jgi:hypothetical protein
MVGLYVNHANVPDEHRRTRIFAGNLFLYCRSRATEALCDHAIGFIARAFGAHDPQRAQFVLPVESFVAAAGPLKTKFTNDLVTKELVRDLLTELGCDLEETYFDVPRLRIVPHGGYLSAGVSYAYKPHRDIWYAGPGYQVNYWMPVFELVPECAMSFFPAYFAEPVPNSSSEFDYDEWCSVGRRSAIAQIATDTRKHPLPLEPIDMSSELRIAGTKGDMFLFSASHLHATAPNESGLTRFSIDFRTINLTDIRAKRAAPNADSRSTGTTLGDFLRAADFKPIDREYVDHGQAAQVI